MFTRATAAIAGMVFEPAGRVLGWVVWIPLPYTVEAVRLTRSVRRSPLRVWTARLPLAAVNIGRLNPWVTIAYYAALTGGFLMTQHEPVRTRLRALWADVRSRVTLVGVVGLLVVVAILVWVVAGALPDGKLHAYFLDMGQGDAILVVTPRGN